LHLGEVLGSQKRCRVNNVTRRPAVINQSRKNPGYINLPVPGFIIFDNRRIVQQGVFVSVIRQNFIPRAIGNNVGPAGRAALARITGVRP
jgi:hypothetical protein